MQLTADQELRRELLLFSLSKQSDLEAAINLAAQMEEFVLKGSREKGVAGEGPAAANGSELGQPAGRIEHPKISRDLPCSETTVTTASMARPSNGISGSRSVTDLPAAGGASKKRRWSEGDDERLRRLWHSDHPLEEIAEAMGRTTPSLYSRARSLGMSKRSPAADKRELCRTNRGGRQPASAGAPPSPAGEDDLAGGAAPKSDPVQSTARRAEIEAKRHPALQRHYREGSDRVGGVLSGGREPKRSGTSAGASFHQGAFEAGVEPIIHFLRSRDYSVVRVENGRFKLDGRRILNADELREKANQVAVSLGKPPFAPQYAGSVG